jgi:hypothetical protein
MAVKHAPLNAGGVAAGGKAGGVTGGGSAGGVVGEQLCARATDAPSAASATIIRAPKSFT